MIINANDSLINVISHPYAYSIYVGYHKFEF